VELLKTFTLLRQNRAKAFDLWSFVIAAHADAGEQGQVQPLFVLLERRLLVMVEEDAGGKKLIDESGDRQGENRGEHSGTAHCTTSKQKTANFPFWEFSF
jgi:hypothetical protein